MRPIPAKIRRRAQRIKLLLLDVDGVMTDGGIVMNHEGEETKRFDVRDGHGIRLLISAGIQVGSGDRAILSSSDPSGQGPWHPTGLPKGL